MGSYTLQYYCWRRRRKEAAKEQMRSLLRRSCFFLTKRSRTDHLGMVRDRHRRERRVDGRRCRGRREVERTGDRPPIVAGEMARHRPRTQDLERSHLSGQIVSMELDGARSRLNQSGEASGDDVLTAVEGSRDVYAVERVRDRVEVRGRGDTRLVADGDSVRQRVVRGLIRISSQEGGADLVIEDLDHVMSRRVGRRSDQDAELLDARSGPVDLGVLNAA